MRLIISCTRTDCGRLETEQVQTLVTATVYHCANFLQPITSCQLTAATDTRHQTAKNLHCTGQQSVSLLAISCCNIGLLQICLLTVRVDMYGVLCGWVAK